MPDPTIVDFKPRWMRELSAEDRRVLEEVPPTGSVPEGPPRIHTRLEVISGRARVSFRALTQALDRTQAIARFAAYDVLHGANPDFADLRSTGAEVMRLGELTADPLEAGSFVIPARLEAEPIEKAALAEGRRVTTQDVVHRFGAILSGFAASGPVTDVSIGALQAIEGLGHVLCQEAAVIEYHLFDSLGQEMSPVRVTSETIERVRRVRQARRPTQSSLEALEGRITALDLVEQKLTLSLHPSGQRVKGTFSPLYQPTVMEGLGRRVRLLGTVEYRGKRPVSIQVQSVEVVDECE